MCVLNLLVLHKYRPGGLRTHDSKCDLEIVPILLSPWVYLQGDIGTCNGVPPSPTGFSEELGPKCFCLWSVGSPCYHCQTHEPHPSGPVLLV